MCIAGGQDGALTILGGLVIGILGIMLIVAVALVALSFALFGPIFGTFHNSGWFAG